MNQPETEQNSKGFLLKIKPISSHLVEGIVEIDAQTVNAVRKQITSLYKDRIVESGFKQTPLEYIQEYYKKEINSALKSFILRYYVIDFLTHEILDQNIYSANHPRLTNLELTENDKALYTFDISITEPIAIREWKHFLFRSPKRKNYKDLDKQVSLFIKREQELGKKRKGDIIEDKDWICFNAVLVNETGSPVLEKYKNNLWAKITLGTISDPFIESFIGKKVGDTLLTNKLSLYDNYEDDLTGKHHFFITITAIIKGGFCSMDAFKAMFKLKNKSDIHEKLIEVFSYRNDISQRKSIIEEMFNLFFSKHRFEIPKHLVIRKQEEILLALRNRPDYQVYKLQKNFINQVATLAEKQLKEEILIDQIASHENIKTETKDIQNYLNLFSNQRLKEFVYFKPIYTLFEDSSVPVHDSTLRQMCRREKTLNHVLYHLTR